MSIYRATIILGCLRAGEIRMLIDLVVKQVSYYLSVYIWSCLRLLIKNFIVHFEFHWFTLGNKLDCCIIFLRVFFTCRLSFEVISFRYEWIFLPVYHCGGQRFPVLPQWCTVHHDRGGHRQFAVLLGCVGHLSPADAGLTLSTAQQGQESNFQDILFPGS